MVISIIIGLLIWLVLPLLFENTVKRKNVKKALTMTCKIIGAAVIVMAVVRQLQ